MRNSKVGAQFAVEEQLKGVFWN